MRPPWSTRQGTLGCLRELSENSRRRLWARNILSRRGLIFGSYGPNRWLRSVPSFMSGERKGRFGDEAALTSLLFGSLVLFVGGEICILSESSGAERRKERAPAKCQYEFAMGVGDDDATDASLPRRKYAPEIRFWAKLGETKSASHRILVISCRSCLRT